MIDWDVASRCSAALVADPERTWRAVDAVVERAPCFQNTTFPLSPLPVMVEGRSVDLLRDRIGAYVRLLGKTIRLYREHEELRAWYALGAAAERLIDAERDGDLVEVCRLDGYLDQGTERLTLLENNADAPAGTLFSARVNRIVHELLASLDVEVPVLDSLTYHDEAALLTTLLQCLRRAGGASDAAHVAVLQPAGQGNRESHEMAEVFRRRGVDAYVADPRQLHFAKGRADFGGRPVDVCWNKVNTVNWRRMVECDEELVARWAAALGDTSLVHVNSFGARYVAESKLTLALPQEPRFAALFSAEERALAGELLPWSRRLDATAIPDDVVGSQVDYVLKQPYDIRGDGVTVGRAVPHSTWKEAVAQGLRQGWLVQRYVAPTSYPVPQRSGPALVAMPISLDTYVLGGEPVGFGSKGSLAPKVNVFQGGQKLAVYVA